MFGKVRSMKSLYLFLVIVAVESEESRKYRSVVSEMINFFPGSKSGEAVEIGQESLWVEFGTFFQSPEMRVLPCADGPTMAMCASTTIEGNDGLSGTSKKYKSRTKMRCWNVSSIAIQTNSDSGSLRASVELGTEGKITDFDATTTVVVEEGVFCSAPTRVGNSSRPIVAKNALATFSFRTVSAPEVPDGAKTANTTVTTKRYHVYGIGVFMNDVATIDVSAGTFYGDVSIYLLRYYRTFVDAKTALEEATVTSSFGRECAMTSDSSTEKWLLLKKNDAAVGMNDDSVFLGSSNDFGINGDTKNKKKFEKTGKDTAKKNAGGSNSAAALATGPETDDDVVTVSDEGRFIILVNAGKFPKVEVEYRADDFDHVRVRTEFYFEPTLRSYPFQRQTLPVTLELASDVLRQTPSKLLCLLTPYSGFAPKLSSFSAAENEDNVLTASALVDEAPRAPPFPSCGRSQFRVVRESNTATNLLRGSLKKINAEDTTTNLNPAPGSATELSSSLIGTNGDLSDAGNTAQQPGATSNQQQNAPQPNQQHTQTTGTNEDTKSSTLLSFLMNKNPCSPRRSTSRLSLNLVYEPPTRVGAMVLLPSGLIGCGALVSYALADPVSRLQTLATSLLAAVVQHASIRSALPPRSVVTTADEFAFSVYAVVAVATAASFFVALDNTQRARNLAACAGAASIVFFLHAKQPAGLDLDWSPALLAFILVFLLLASLVHPEFVLGVCGLRLAVVQSTARGIAASHKNRSGVFRVASGVFSSASPKSSKGESVLSPRTTIPNDTTRGVRRRSVATAAATAADNACCTCTTSQIDDPNCPCNCHRQTGRRQTSRYQREFKDKHSPSPPERTDNLYEGADSNLISAEDATDAPLLYRAAARYAASAQASADNNGAAST